VRRQTGNDGSLPAAEALLAAPPLAPPEPSTPRAQWGEAYLLFDGDYLSLDDLLDTLTD
jgi:hypothetical protein